MRLISFVVVAITAIAALYPDHGFVNSIGGSKSLLLPFALPIVLITAAGFALGAQLAVFLFLMSVASIFYLWLTLVASIGSYAALGLAFSIDAPKPYWLHFVLLSVLPCVLILGAGFGMGVLSNRHVFIRGLIFIISGVALQPVAFYVAMILLILVFGF